MKKGIRIQLNRRKHNKQASARQAEVDRWNQFYQSNDLTDLLGHAELAKKLAPPQSDFRSLVEAINR
ncbi:MAG: hypothetical protein V4436_02995 [Patescibacteria group bacterium]